MKLFATYSLAFLIPLAVVALAMQPVYSSNAGSELNPGRAYWIKMQREMKDVAVLCIGLSVCITGMVVIAGGEDD